MNKVVIFGGTGFIGLSLAGHLTEKGYEPVLVGRNKPADTMPYKFVKWNAVSIGDWVQELNHAKAIVNLAGRTVDCIKTPDNCDLILRSRVDSVKVIGQAVKMVANPPKVWVQMSTAHIYGDPPTQVCTEESTYGYGLAPFVGKAWEKAFSLAKPADIRGVVLRTSFVIGKNGGALESLKNIVSLGLGGKAGSGQQGMSWIHEHDMNEMMYQAIVDEAYKGAYIVSSPYPLSNKEFMKILRKKMKMPIGLSAPEPMIRIGANLFFKTDPELVLYGRYVKPKRLEEQKFAFKYPDLSSALDHLLQ